MGFGIGGGVVEGNHREALMAVGERVGRMVVAIVGDAEGGSVDLLGESHWGPARRGRRRRPCRVSQQKAQAAAVTDIGCLPRREQRNVARLLLSRRS
nr:hypothetical protein Itr_chr12CG15660 [Ipomoea trifida]